MTIGAHTLSHPILSLCSDEEARHEIQQSKNDLEQALGRQVWAFAYPFGNSATMGEREVGTGARSRVRLRIPQRGALACGACESLRDSSSPCDCEHHTA